MKMRDVFKLPVEADILDDVAIFRYKKNKPTSDDADKAAAHAINCHDGLINAVDVLLNHPEVADYGAICELLTRAKGES